MAYKPNKAIHPGRVILRSLEREGMKQKNLGERTGLSEKHISQIINGEASITVETALLLENALGGAASFWINLEKNYQEARARIDREAALREEVPLVSKFPYLELQKRGYVEPTTSRENRVENLWKFFGVNSLSYVQRTEPVAYRRRSGKQVKSEAISAWLRCAELESRKVKPEPFSASKLKQSLESLRRITTEPAEKFSVEARDVLLNCGVSLVYVPHFKGTGVSGAVRWVGNNPLIQLSLLGAYADIFWFNLFHEIGHLLLHSKKEKFIEFDKRDLSASQEKEREADEFAGNALIPKAAYREFLRQGDLSRGAVEAFAHSIDIDAGIVEGRLCHEGVSPAVSWSKQLGFRYRLKFAED